MTRRDRVTRDKTPRINTYTYTHTSRHHLYPFYVATRALLILLALLNLLNLLDLLILINLQPLPATFTKFEEGTQRSLRLIHIGGACSPTGPLKEVKLVCVGARAPSGLKASEGGGRPSYIYTHTIYTTCQPVRARM